MRIVYLTLALLSEVLECIVNRVAADPVWSGGSSNGKWVRQKFEGDCHDWNQNPINYRKQYCQLDIPDNFGNSEPTVPHSLYAHKIDFRVLL